MGNSIKPGFFLFNDNGDNNTDLQNRIKAAFPQYYIHDTDISEIDIATAFLSWQTIMESDDIESYIAAKLTPDFEFTSCLSWFFSVFYDKFFELCPESKEMFVNVSILGQGRLLAGVISSSFDVLKNPERLEKRLIKIVNRHNPMNIKAVYYGLMGEALLWTLQFTLGSRFTADCTLAWKKIYSFLLTIIIPRAVEYEYKLSLPAGRGRGIGGVSQKSSGSEKSTIRTSMRSIKSTIEERIRNSTSLFHNTNTNGSSKKMGGVSSLSNKCPFEVHEITDTTNFESIDYCPFTRKSINMETTIMTPASTSGKEEISLRKKRASRSNSRSIDDKPVQVEGESHCLYQRTCPLDTTQAEVKSAKIESQHHRSVYLKSLLSIELTESDDMKVPYFNHPGKCPIQPIGTIATTTDCNMSDISYDDFKVNKLNRYTNKDKATKPPRAGGRK